MGDLETVDGRSGLQERAGPSFAKEHLRVRLGPRQGCLPLREEGIQVFNILGPDLLFLWLLSWSVRTFVLKPEEATDLPSYPQSTQKGFK